MDELPYRIAVLVFVFDAADRVLLLHRVKPPNRRLYSPVGGKLETKTGESPLACAIRELDEETGLAASPAELHLTGIVSETAYQGQTHWLMFLYELKRRVEHPAGAMDEGELGWHEPSAVADLPLPATDRHVIWPMFRRYRGRFFSAHIDCRGGRMAYRIEQPTEDATGSWTAVEAESG